MVFFSRGRPLTERIAKPPAADPDLAESHRDVILDVTAEVRMSMVITKPENDDELRQAIAALIHRPNLTRADKDQQIRSLLQHVERRGLSLEHCLIIKRGRRIVSCCLCVDSPGHTSAVYIPSWIPDGDAADNLVSLLAETAERARGRGIHFVQAIIPPEAALEHEIYGEAGFEPFAELIYMERDLTQSLPVGKPPPPLQWVTYGPDTYGLFAKTVLETYEDSLDCARLNGLRHIDDILASHRATGVFTPETWLVGVAEGAPVGVLLLSRMPEQSAMEVVYMGLRACCRGKGYAAALLAHGVRAARDLAALRLTLAVDAINAPARKLYARFGFSETLRRSALIRLLGPANSSADEKTRAES